MQSSGRNIALAAAGVVLAGGLLAQGLATYRYHEAAPAAPSVRETGRDWYESSEQERMARYQALANFMDEQGWIDLEAVTDLRTAVREQYHDPSRRDAIRAFLVEWHQEQNAPEPSDVIEARGVQVGQPFPAIEAIDILGEPVPLVNPAAERPTLIVTGSITSPPARRSIPRLPELARIFDDRLRIVVLYTTEANPETSSYRRSRYGYGYGYSGYSGRESRTTEPPQEEQRPSFEREQPATVGGRIELALELQELAGLNEAPLIDPMDDPGYRTIGGGPNMAVLVGADGKVLFKQGHFQPATLRQALQQHLPK